MSHVTSIVDKTPGELLQVWYQRSVKKSLCVYMCAGQLVIQFVGTSASPGRYQESRFSNRAGMKL